MNNDMRNYGFQRVQMLICTRNLSLFNIYLKKLLCLFFQQIKIY